MKSFLLHAWDPIRCRQELEQFRALAAANVKLTERKHIRRNRRKVPLAADHGIVAVLVRWRQRRLRTPNAALFGKPRVGRE